MPSITDNLPSEHGFVPLEIEGKLPPGLAGTLYRNGPALTERFGRRYRHIFEGDGGFAAARFDGQGGASGACRVLRTPAFMDEEAAGRMLSGFSAPWLTRMKAQLSGLNKNTANTSVLSWGGGLYGLMEGGKPTQVDPETLEVIGESDLGGAVSGTFSAHPHRVAATDTLVNFGQVYGKDPALRLYAWPRGGACRLLGAVPMSSNRMVHDFIVTERHAVFFLGPAEIVVWRAVLGLGSFNDLFAWRPELGAEVLVVPLHDVSQVTRFTTEAFWVWHFANAWEEGGEIVVDYVRNPDLGSLGEIGEDVSGPSTSRLHRARIDLTNKRFTSEELSPLPCEFPKVHPRVEGARYASAWVQFVSDEGRHGVARLRPDGGQEQRFTLDAGWEGSEPVFVPRPGGVDEEDGWVITLEYDGARHKSAFAVYAADAISAGPLGRAWFDHHVHQTFHGAWVG